MPQYFLWGTIWFGWIFRIAVIGLIVWLIVRTLNRNNQSHNNQQVKETPTDILKRRYAKGEINKEQFEIMKKDLES